MRSRFQNAPPQHQPAPCRGQRQQLLECLRAHPGESLRCTALVSQFTQCVGQHRSQLLDAKHGAKPAAAAPTGPPAVAAH